MFQHPFLQSSASYGPNMNGLSAPSQLLRDTLPRMLLLWLVCLFTEGSSALAQGRKETKTQSIGAIVYHHCMGKSIEWQKRLPVTKRLTGKPSGHFIYASTVSIIAPPPDRQKKLTLLQLARTCGGTGSDRKWQLWHRHLIDRVLSIGTLVVSVQSGQFLAGSWLVVEVVPFCHACFLSVSTAIFARSPAFGMSLRLN